MQLSVWWMANEQWTKTRTHTKPCGEKSINTSKLFAKNTINLRIWEFDSWTFCHMWNYPCKKNNDSHVCEFTLSAHVSVMFTMWNSGGTNLAMRVCVLYRISIYMPSGIRGMAIGLIPVTKSRHIHRPAEMHFSCFQRLSCPPTFTRHVSWCVVVCSLNCLASSLRAKTDLS